MKLVRIRCTIFGAPQEYIVKAYADMNKTVWQWKQTMPIAENIEAEEISEEEQRIIQESKAW